jgi:hypothetical protein
VLGDGDDADVGQRKWPTLLVRQVKPLEPIDGAELRQDSRIVADRAAPEYGRIRLADKQERQRRRIGNSGRWRRTVQTQPDRDATWLAIDDQHDRPFEDVARVFPRRRDQQLAGRHLGS